MHAKIPFTEGPWIVEPNEFDNGITRAICAGDDVLAVIMLDPEINPPEAERTPENVVRSSVDEGNAQLMASAPDYRLIILGLLHGVMEWDRYGGKIPGKGEVRMGGILYSTSLDNFGVPKLTPPMRAQILRLLTQPLQRRAAS